MAHLVLTGAPLAELKKRAGERLAAGDPWDEREYEMYPPELKSPYRERRSAFGEQRYGALGIAREDLEARQRAASANWDCFGAPAALFCYIDRDLGPPQWADVGMYLQTVMLLLRAEGLHSCPQMAWSSVSQDRRGGPVTPGRAHPLLRHVDRVRGRHGGFTPVRAGRRSTRRSRSSTVSPRAQRLSGTTTAASATARSWEPDSTTARGEVGPM